MIAIPVVFLKRDDFGRVKLTTIGAREHLASLGIELQEGMRVVLRTDDADDAGNRDDLLADGIVTFNHTEGIWVADVDEQSFRHASEDA